jgi:hypothetical protein
MKKLIAIGTLALALGFASLPFAPEYMCWLRAKPLVKSEIRNDIKGGKIEKDFMMLWYL